MSVYYNRILPYNPQFRRLADVADLNFAGPEIVSELIHKLCHEDELASIGSQVERVARGCEAVKVTSFAFPVNFGVSRLL